MLSKAEKLWNEMKERNRAERSEKKARARMDSKPNPHSNHQASKPGYKHKKGASVCPKILRFAGATNHERVTWRRVVWALRRMLMRHIRIQH